MGLVCVAAINLSIYTSAKQKYEICLNSLGVFKRIYDFAKWMAAKGKDIFVSEDVRQALRKLHKMARVIVGMSGRRQSTMTGDAIAILADYIWGILFPGGKVFKTNA